MPSLPEQIVLSEEEREEIAAKVAELHARGYQDITEHKGLRAGTRIRHRGQQFAEAFRNGTGFVAALLEKPDSSWSQTNRMPDIELVAVFDKPMLSRSRLSQLAQYHVDVIEVPDV